jgi:FkbM family methyltransferase
MVVRILQGPLRGYRWVAGAGPNGLWLGSYELSKQKRLMEFLQEGSVVYDIGANAGIYTLLSSECIGRTGHVHAFEPLPENLAFLERHIKMNRRQNVSVHPLAVSSNSEKLRFARTGSRFTGHIDCDGDLEVNTVSLDEFVFDARNQAPTLMKIDVEGGELNVLRGAQRLLAVSPPVIFLATHGAEVHSACCDLLGSFGYRLEGVTGEPIDGTDELICFPPAR